MIRRREFVKSSLLGAAALGSPFTQALLAADSTAPIVATKYGRVRGTSSAGVFTFKGIHYGASPEGSARFQPPSPPQPWKETASAQNLGDLAPQILSTAAGGSDIRQAMGDIFGPGKVSENCLVLNVWTPSLEHRRRPVMVWLHGGGYTGGSDGSPTYDGTNLAHKQGVVVVGINHRLNVFGYLYLGGISKKYADSGNVGMLDCVLALEWVRDNIASFGGDPENVTIFGESGGGGKVSVLMAMPPAKDLFHKAIVESGSTLRVSTPDEADAAARKYLAQLKISPDRVDELQKVPMEQMLDALKSMAGPNSIRLGPVVDGRSLPRQPFDPDAPAQSANIPMLIGTNGTESSLLLGMGDASLFSLDDATMRAKLKTYLHLTDDAKLDDLIAIYKKDRPGATPSDLYFAITTDRMMRMNAIAQAERKIAQGAAPAYMYIFNWRTPILDGRLRSPHGIELAFVFDNTDKTTSLNGSAPDVAPLAAKVSAAWAAFARTGNPSTPGLPWPAYDTKNRATMVFNDDCKVVDDPGKEERQAITAIPN
jgi:para-nitrobenzyl esterase